MAPARRARRGQLAGKNPHRLSVIGGLHVAVRHRQGEGLLREGRP